MKSLGTFIGIAEVTVKAADPPVTHDQFVFLLDMRRRNELNVDSH